MRLKRNGDEPVDMLVGQITPDAVCRAFSVRSVLFQCIIIIIILTGGPTTGVAQG